MRVVLDTNVLVSALLFVGPVSRIHALWKERSIVPVVSKETFAEFLAVLSYPKFQLTDEERRTLVEEECLPYFEVVEVTETKRLCLDPDDDKFLACAAATRAGHLVTGDKHLLALREHQGAAIVTVAVFLNKLDGGRSDEAD